MNLSPPEGLIEAWQAMIKPAFQMGYLINDVTLLSELKYFLAEPMPWAHFWLKPRLAFPPTEGPIFDQLQRYQVRQNLKDQAVSLLITEREVVVAAVEVQFLPQDYVDYRPSMRRLSGLDQLRGEEDIYLGWGAERQTYQLGSQMLLAYAAITRKSSLALQARSLRQALGTEAFPAPLLHLIGAVDGDESTFTAQWIR
jgi:hypothetical protein